MNKILITGGLGHIGTKVLEYIPDGVEVLVIDNSKNAELKQKTEQKHSNVTIQDHDLRNLSVDDIKSLLEESNIKRVMHLAATVNAIETVDHEKEVYENNTDVVSRLAEACANRVDRFVFMSTASVYGPNSHRRYSFSSDLNPQTPYAKSKLKAEVELLKYSEQIPTIKIYRAGTIYGLSDGIRFHTAINQFVRDAVFGNPVTIWEPGTGKRPYVDVATMSQILCKNTLAGSNRTVVQNVANSHWSPLEIVDTIREVLPKTEVGYVTPRILNQDSYILDSDVLPIDTTLLKLYIHDVISLLECKV